jgi:uncharacterized membrane protein (UPF0127 family)
MTTPRRRLVRTDTGQELASGVEVARSFASRLRGLLGRDRLAEGEGLWIEPCDGVHTWFMRFAIDVAFVDGDGRVLRRIDALRPWRATRLHPGARACVELPAGTLARCGVTTGTPLALVAQEPREGA